MLFYRLLHYLTFKCVSWNSPCAWPALKICMWYDHTKWQSNHPSWLIQWWKYSDNLRSYPTRQQELDSLALTNITYKHEEFCWKSDYIYIYIYRERERERERGALLTCSYKHYLQTSKKSFAESLTIYRERESCG
jgi:hypothetical protein